LEPIGAARFEPSGPPPMIAGDAQVQNPSARLDAVEDGVGQIGRVRAGCVGARDSRLKEDRAHQQRTAGADRRGCGPASRRQNAGDVSAMRAGGASPALGRVGPRRSQQSDAFGRKLRVVRGCGTVDQPDSNLGSAGGPLHKTDKAHHVQG
jgi:hypothetical protein